jgi:hypothetical protein
MGEAVELALQGQAITPTPPNQTPAAGMPATEPASQPSPQAQIALQYISEREGIPIEDLGFEERVRSYPNLGKQYVAVSMYDRKSFRTFVVLVGLQDNQVTDLETVEQAEAQAYRAKYGKLSKALYERLQAAGADELLTVGIWVAVEPDRAEGELYALLASRYPQAQAALDRHLPPWNVDDPALSKQIKDEYLQMLQADIDAYIQPLKAHLESQGISVRTQELLPSITCDIQKAVILALQEREDVTFIDLIEGVEQPAIGTAVPTQPS